MALSRTYLTVNGKIRSEQRSGESGSRDYVLDGSGSVVGVYRNGWLQPDGCYEPYGEINTQWNMGIDGYRFTWGGGFGYRQTGLAYSSVYVRARHYSNKNAAWLSVDQLWPQEMPYGYVGGRVPGSVDPTGLNPCLTSKDCECVPYHREDKDQKRYESPKELLYKFGTKVYIAYQDNSEIWVNRHCDWTRKRVSRVRIVIIDKNDLMKILCTKLVGKGCEKACQAAFFAIFKIKNPLVDAFCGSLCSMVDTDNICESVLPA
jgi:hypothetical protein